jgi:hypothetical protein
MKVCLREPPRFVGLRALTRTGYDVETAEASLVERRESAQRSLVAQTAPDAQVAAAVALAPSAEASAAAERAALLAVPDTEKRGAALQATERLSVATAKEQERKVLRSYAAVREMRETQSALACFGANLPLGLAHRSGAPPHVWTEEECAAFEKQLLLHGTDFGAVSRGVIAATQREARLAAEAAHVAAGGSAATAGSVSPGETWVCGVQDAVLYYYGVFKQLPEYRTWKTKRKKLRDDVKSQLTAWFHRAHREVNNETAEEQLEGEERNDSCCSVCEDGGELICCDGTCRRVFHSRCVAMTAEEIESDDPWLCTECSTQVRRR